MARMLHETTTTGQHTETGERPGSCGRRVLAGVLAGACLSLLILAAWLSPSSDGHGTHTQLGFRPCAWASLSDKPCPSCGMTTAFAYAAEGSFTASMAAQPMGFMLAMGAATIFWGALHVAVFGSAVGQFAAHMVRPSTLWIFGGAAAAAWAYKIVTWPGIS